MTREAVELSETFARIARTLRAGGVQHTLERTVELAVQTVPGCVFAGVSVARTHTAIDTPAATSAVAASADRLQYESGEGPCLLCLGGQLTMRVDDLLTDERWPSWGPRAAALGIGSMRCFSLRADERTLGVLTLYSPKPAGFTDEDDAVGAVFAAHAAMALASAQSEEGLMAALENHNVIGQAQGILMERHHLTPGQAFEVLRRASHAARAKLSQIARHVVETGEVP